MNGLDITLIVLMGGYCAYILFGRKKHGCCGDCGRCGGCNHREDHKKEEHTL